MQFSIKKFAIDYRKIYPKKWNLPYIRLGGNGCDCAINIGSSIENDKFNPSMSELDKIWWVWKNIDEFGKTDYFGFCHWRRFFSLYTHNLPILNISKDMFNPLMCLSPEDELSIIVDNQAIGASIVPIKFSDKKYIWEQITDLDPTMPTEINKILFEIMYKISSIDFKQYIEKAFEMPTQYVCNIFTLDKEHFCELSNIMFNALQKFDDIIPLNIKKNFHPRYLGYYGERIVSCYLHALQLSNKKIIHFPLLTVDANKHNEVKIDEQTGFKYEVK